jgi:hypothetical protein
MGAQGTTSVDFGAFPGKSDASVDVTGQADIVAGSLVEAWIRPVDSADHLADEHIYETIGVVAGNIISSVGFTIYMYNTSQLFEKLDKPSRDNAAPAQNDGAGTRLYGVFNVNWVWN